jgi:hypothetical protein
LIKTIGYSILIVLCVISTELTGRLYWEAKIPGAFFDSDRIIYNYQRNLLGTGLPDADVRGDDGYFDVLLLGGSVVAHGFGRIDDYLAEGLSDIKGQVRVWNGAEAAHTSRDSWEKYSLLADKHFDLVIVYDGINESRFNNAEPGQFRPDYSHVGWYRQINAFHEHWEIGYFVLPFILHKMLIDVESEFGWFASKDGVNLPNASNRPTLTRDSFSHYIQLIVDTARARGEPVALVTYALYSPLSTDEWLKTRAWGYPKMIEQDVAAHNDVLRRIGSSASNVIPIEMVGAIESSRDSFFDACHLTDKGAHRWADVFLEQSRKSPLFGSPNRQAQPAA